MTAGYNLRVDYYRRTQLGDDVIGGAASSLAKTHAKLPFHISPVRPSQLLLQQGLETTRTFIGSGPGRWIGARVDYREGDEIEVVSPSYHAYIDKRFRIIGVQIPNIDLGRGTSHVELNLQHIERTRTEQ